MNRIKEIITERGIKMTKIAEKLEAKSSHLSMWISEQRYPSQERLLKLARHLKVSVKDLYPNAVRRTFWEIKNKEKGL